MTLHSLQRNLKSFNIRSEIREVIEQTSGEIAELNRGQLFIGRRSDGKEINPQYSPLTVMIKEEKGQPTDRVTLKDKGDFWNSIAVDVNSDSFTIDATDNKTNKLVKKYGKEIMGLNKESKAEYKDNYLFPALKERIERKLQLKFR